MTVVIASMLPGNIIISSDGRIRVDKKIVDDNFNKTFACGRYLFGYSKTVNFRMADDQPCLNIEEHLISRLQSNFLGILELLDKIIEILSDLMENSTDSHFPFNSRSLDLLVAGPEAKNGDIMVIYKICFTPDIVNKKILADKDVPSFSNPANICSKFLSPLEENFCEPFSKAINALYDPKLSIEQIQESHFDAIKNAIDNSKDSYPGEDPPVGGTFFTRSQNLITRNLT